MNAAPFTNARRACPGVSAAWVENTASTVSMKIIRFMR